MQNGVLSLEPLRDSYGSIYATLGELRETFHRSGRLDDSNAKLDEVAKLFATYIAFKRGLISSFPSSTSKVLVDELQRAFFTAAHLPQYTFAGAKSIFGAQPKLVLRDEDESLARDLVYLVRQCVDLAYELRESGKPFDILNEAFGHFVRDNFRGNVEDAQYMTPPEVVEFMVEMALHDLQGSFLADSKKHWTVVDPSCGVGSYLAALYHRVKATDSLPTNRLRLIGQDKVERMARLATINLELFDVEEHRITVGNSLEIGSPLDNINGCVDLILTNPPFGARFNTDYVHASCGENTPFFSSTGSTSNVDSELLFIDRNLRLLRDGGHLLIVIPDGVVSAKGTAAMLRQHLGNVASVKAVVELPAVTFAQAGTRTKTAILSIEKKSMKQRTNVFMAIAQDLGYQVSTRKGVQIKKPIGKNELPDILTEYKNWVRTDTENSEAIVLRAGPSCVSLNEADMLRGSWTPNHYSSTRFSAINGVRSARDIEMIPLSKVAEFCAEERRNERWKPGMAFLSILHVLGEGFLDIASAQTYAPKTPGIPTYPGEILVSRINPRIPRVCVTPDFGKKTLCSSEFEVLRPKDDIDPFLLAYLLLTDVVQDQIRSLTSGTSASHNRIRSSELMTVLVPLPRVGSSKQAELETLARNYRDAFTTLVSATSKIAALRVVEKTLFAS